ncbi:alpha/beta fold hydrolase [Flavihumibacter sp.]|uniref:alpha/beta fold hydrolase n=1 Tax=Flavihumibacter sp. TaxID=1913981 RepID=UPI002FCC7CDE
MKRTVPILILVLALWLVLAQSCFTFRTPDKKVIADFREKGIELKTRYVKSEDYTIHYVQSGADTLPTLVFIHGTPGSWTAFEPYHADSLLLSRFRMISIDRPGFGYSNFGKAINQQQQSALMLPVIRSFKNGKPLWLVGHSLGGATVLQLELDSPGISDGLVIISGSIDPALEKPERWRYVVAHTPLKLLLPGAFRPSNEELIYLKEDLKIMKPRLAEMRAPVLFIHGESDKWVPPSNVDFGMKMLTGSAKLDTAWISGGHFIPWTAFESVRDYLLSVDRKQ